MISGSYYRNTAKCNKCGSLPRHRALFYELTRLYPNWREMAIHESSPGWDMVTQRLASECKNYIASHYDKSQESGTVIETSMPCKLYHCENLEGQSFADSQFDIVIMQDVFEHIFDPAKALSEIERTLKPGGSLIMTVPLVNGFNPSKRRASIDGNDNIVHLEPPDYHGNPIDNSGSLVTIDWGYDICSYIARLSCLAPLLVRNRDVRRGVIGDLAEVIIARKIDYSLRGSAILQPEC